MNLPALKPTIYAIVALGVFLGGYKAGSLAGDAEVSELEKNQAAEREQAAVKLSQEVLANDLLKARLQSVTTRNLELVAAAGSSIPTGVQLPATLCADYGQTYTPGSSEQAGQASRVLLEGIERILSADRSRVAGIITEAEVELTHCREIKEWAKAHSAQ